MKNKTLSIFGILLQLFVGNSYGSPGVGITMFNEILPEGSCNKLQKCPLKSNVEFVGGKEYSDSDYQCCSIKGKCGETEEFCNYEVCQSGGCFEPDPSVADDDSKYTGMDYYLFCHVLVQNNKCGHKCPCQHEDYSCVDGECVHNDNVIITIDDPEEEFEFDRIDTDANNDDDVEAMASNACGSLASGQCSKDCQCPKGYCCSQYGWCGKSSQHCGVGCISGDCTEQSVSPNSCPDISTGSCNAECPCPESDQCCSSHGYCGTSIDFCGTNCISGNCLNSQTSVTPQTTKAQSGTSAAPDPIIPNPDVDCSGVRASYMCNSDCPCLNSKHCCSKHGYCGTSSEYCGDGCQNGPCSNGVQKTTTTKKKTSSKSSSKSKTKSKKTSTTTGKAKTTKESSKTKGKTTTTTTTKKTTATSTPKPKPSGKGKAGVIMYLTNWSIYSRFANVASFDFTGVDVINYAFIDVDSKGNIASLDVWADDGWQQIGLIDMININIKKKFPKLKTVISVGGWSCSDTFTYIARSSTARVNFAQQLKEYYTNNGFDGVDIDWEYPKGGGLTNDFDANDDKNYLLMLKEIRNAIGDDALLTVAHSANASIYGSYLKEISTIVDWINIMTYDMAGAWNTYSGFNSPLRTDSSKDKNNQASISSSLQGYLDMGISPDRLVIGSAFYGRSWQVISSENNGAYQQCKQTSWGVQGTPCAAIVGDSTDVSYAATGTWAYYYLRQGPLSGGPDSATSPWVRTFHDLETCPSLFNYNTNVFIGYDDPESIRAKTKFAQEQGLAGIMVWEISQDYNRELLDAMTEQWNEE